MKPITTLFLCIVFVLGVQAQNQQVTYPFKIENKRIILQYPENGQLLQMIFSSIYPLDVLSSKAADKINYEYISKGDSFPVGNYYVPVYQLKKGFDKYFFAGDFSHIEEYKNLDGILGNKLLNSNVVDIDFENEKISVMKTMKDNLTGRNIDTLQMNPISWGGNTIYYTKGIIEYNHKKIPANLILNFVDIPLQAEISDSLYNKEADQSIEILSPFSFKDKIKGERIRSIVSYHSPDESFIWLGLPFLRKYKNVIFDYPHNRVLLVN